jgi:hypothetical protein
LREDNVLPLTVKYAVRVEAKVNKPGYFYLFWIDTEGTVAPIYPWRPGKWESRPAEEKAISELHLPEDPQILWKVKKGPAGMETLLLLVRETPWPQDKDLRKLLSDLTVQKWQNPQSVVWFENWEEVHNEPERGPNFFDVAKRDDPVMDTQRLLKERLGEYCAYSRAACFASLTTEPANLEALLRALSSLGVGP